MLGVASLSAWFLEMWRDFWRLFRPFVPPSLPRMHLGPAGRNPLMFQFFEWNSASPEAQKGASWWQHLEQELEFLAAHGVTQIWAPPPNKAMTKSGRGYDAYDLYDLGEFDQKGTTATRWGTRSELLRAAKTAAELQIGILIDGVLNHKLGADRSEVLQAVEVDPMQRNREIGPVRDIEAWTAFDFKPRNGQYSSMRWTQEHFNGVDYDGRRRKSGIFRFASKRWSDKVDTELGNYDYLLGVNIDHKHVEVRADLFKWGSWAVETIGAIGFRLDAIKHFDYEFTRDFLEHVRSATRRPRLFAVGEYWSTSAKAILECVYKFDGSLAFFDVPLHYNFHNASKMGAAYDLRGILDNTFLKLRPLDAVLFVDNHDTQEGQMLESWVDSSFKAIAYAIILLRPGGYPCVFYGDLYPDGQSYDAQVARKLATLMKARLEFAYGDLIDYAGTRNCVGFVRMGDAQHRGCAVVLCNAGLTRHASFPPFGHLAQFLPGPYCRVSR